MERARRGWQTKHPHRAAEKKSQASNRDGVPIKRKQCNSVAGLCNNENEAENSPLKSDGCLERTEGLSDAINTGCFGALGGLGGGLSDTATLHLDPKGQNAKGKGSTASRQLPAAKEAAGLAAAHAVWPKLKWCLAKRIEGRSLGSTRGDLTHEKTGNRKRSKRMIGCSPGVC